MPPSKKKPKPLADFKKKKSKLGGKKEFDPTAFKAKSISLPNQGLDDASGVAMTRRHLTLKDLLSQSGHYNARIRKTALEGILELVHEHLEAVVRSLQQLVEVTLERMLDCEPPVRKGLHSILKALFRSPLAHAAFHPFLALLGMYVRSAMSHVNEDIRCDGLRFLTLWTQHYPHSVAASIDELLTNFVVIATEDARKGGSLLASGTETSALAARATLLNSLVAMLRVAAGQRSLFGADEPVEEPVGAQDDAPGEWGHASAARRWLDLLAGQPVPAQALLDGVAAAAPGDVLAAASEPSSAASHDASYVPGFVAPLLALVCQCWVDSEPALQPLSADRADVLASVAEVVALLFDHIGPPATRALLAQSRGALGDVLAARFVPHFPFALVQRSAKLGSISGLSARDSIMRLNACLCRVLVVLHEHTLAALPAGAGQGPPPSLPWRAVLVDHLSSCLRSREDGAAAAAWATVLRVLPRAMPLLEPVEQSRLVGAFTESLERADSTSASGASVSGATHELACLTFMHSVAARADSVLGTNAALQTRWLRLLPRLLWQQGGARPQAARRALDVLLCLARIPATQASFQTAFASLGPLLCAVVPQRGGLIFGPFVSWPRDVQQRFLALLDACPSPLSTALVRALLTVTLRRTLADSVLGAALEALERAVARGALGAEVFQSFVLSLAVAADDSEAERAVALAGGEVASLGSKRPRADDEAEDDDDDDDAIPVALTGNASKVAAGVTPFLSVRVCERSALLACWLVRACGCDPRAAAAACLPLMQQSIPAHGTGKLAARLTALALLAQAPELCCVTTDSALADWLRMHVRAVHDAARVLPYVRGAASVRQQAAVGLAMAVVTRAQAAWPELLSREDCLAIRGTLLQHNLDEDC